MRQNFHNKFSLDPEFLDMILNNLPQGVCVTDPNGDFLYVNNTLCFLLGYSKQTFLSFNAYQMVADGLINENLIDDVLKKKKSITKFLNVLRADNTRMRLLQTERPVYDTDGNVIFAVSILRDADTEQHLYLSSEHNYMNASKASPEKESNLVYQSPQMQKIVDSLENICATNVPILLQGDSGTGKEVLAKYIHSHSNRADKPMVCINCAAVPESLLESELFGYEGGAFTGASTKGKAGLFESAQGATLFLDEINSLPLSLQPKLLRVLETNIIQRVGSNKSKHIDFRLIVAANKNLQQCVQEGTFRLDLMYRINAFTINIPPLKDRPDDIIPLTNSFLEYFCRTYITEKHFSPHVYEQLLQHDWPGNVRELRNVVERVVLTSGYNAKVINSLPDNIFHRDSLKKAAKSEPLPEQAVPQWTKVETSALGISFWDRSKNLDENMAFYERSILEDVYEKTNSITKTAELLGINQSTASRKLSKYGISKK